MREGYTPVMSNVTAPVPAGWLASLARSKAEIASGQTVPLLPILDRLRSAAERLEAGGDDLLDAPKQNTGR